jgi:transcription-repair coupling factor (superfamily II helicase)
MVKNQGERWWNKVEQRHDRSGIGSLVRPEDIYISPWDLDDRLRKFSGLELDQLGAVDILDADRSDLSEVDFATRPTQRFHGSIPALIEAINALTQQDARILIAAPNQREVERLVGLLQEYHVAYRLGSRTQAPGSANVYSESSYLAGDLRTPIIVRAAIANGVQVLDLRDADGRATARQLILFGANDLIDDADVQARPVTRSKSKAAAFVSDFRDLAVGDYVVHVEHGIARYCGLRVIEENDQPPLELMILEFADEAKLYVPLTRLDLIQKYRSTDTGPAPQLNKLGTQAWQ